MKYHFTYKRIFQLKIADCRLPIAYCTLLIAHCLFSQGTFAQKQKVAVFAPLYLDSAFDATSTYRYDKNFPKFINPGLEFYEGVQLALDSLNKEKAQLEVFVYDTRSAMPMEQVAAELDSTINLIIAHANTRENWALADVARIKKIPYVNVNLPNDGGITGNPYFVMLNPTLKTHVEGIYRYMQKYFSSGTIVVFRKKGQMEDMIKRYIDDLGKTPAINSLKLKYIDLIDSFRVENILQHFDSTKQNVCLSASLDEHFNQRLVTQIASVSKSYKTSIVGMPTFGMLEKNFSRPEYRGPEIIYGDPFYNPRTNKVSVDITNYFNTKFYARPSDMVMRGYETTWRFIKLMMKNKNEFASSLTAREFNVFREFEIQPVLNVSTNSIDYYENKKLYFIRWQDGIMKVQN